MYSNASRYAWTVILCLVFPSISDGGFFDDLADGLKGILQRPPECSAQAAPIAMHQTATLPVGTEIYKGPGPNCGSYGVINQPLTVSLIGASGNWYLFNATDIAGKNIQAWTSMNNASHAGTTQTQRQSYQTTKYSSYSRELVATVQRSLNSRGYNAGVVDGIYGRGTRAAVMAFQQDSGLTTSGELDQVTLAALKADAQVELSARKQDDRPLDNLKSSASQKWYSEFVAKKKSIDASELDKKTAKKLIELHIGDTYTPVYIGKGNRAPNKELSNAYEVLVKLGLITYKELAPDQSLGGLMASSMGTNVVFESKLTNKGGSETINCTNKKSRNKQKGFLSGKAEIRKIISVNEDDSVFFVYVGAPNEIGRTIWGEGGVKGRGKAFFKFDPFLEKYKFTGWQTTSGWEQEDWQDAYWVDNKNNQLVCK